MKKLLSIIIILLFTTSCSNNPVTGKKEILFIPVEKELSLGDENFLPMQQMQGGSLQAYPEISKYVQDVGLKIASHSGRPELNFEFVILNNSIPNAWTLPGGKIAINRGLLTELKSEAELAAVLSHEIVHAAARHGAQGLQRGMALQIGLAGLSSVLKDHQYSDLMIGSASLGAELITYKYSRKAEYEADHYGMEYMSKSGYDPQEAVTLQETFIGLSEGKKTGWLDGLFATHPPSEDRRSANMQMAQDLPQGGMLGKTEYQQKMQSLIDSKEAYKLIDSGYEALAKNDYSKAQQFAEKATQLIPKEAHAYGLLGKALQDHKQSLAALNKAIELNSGYFDFYLQRGKLLSQDKNYIQAKSDLEASNSLLENAEAHYLLGIINIHDGQKDKAIQHFEIASEANSEIGQQAKLELEKLK